MKFITTSIIAMGVMASVAHAQNKDEAVRVFKEYACDGCHSIKEQNVPIVERDVGDKNTDGRTPPDLSKIGTKHDAEWIGRWLQKKEELQGKTHKRMFKGSKEERDAVSAWLASLK